MSYKARKQLVENLEVEVRPFFSEEELDQLAKECRFVQRESTCKLTGSTFFDLVIFNKEKLKEQSLNGLCIKLKEDHGIEIKKQSLHERFNQNAVLFLGKALEKLLQKQLVSDLPLTIFKSFKRVLLKDSVCFQLDPSLAKDYPGSGGSGSEAAIRIQFEYDLLSGKIIDLSINSFNSQDAKNSIATLHLTQEGDLIIRDLAYMHVDVLKELIEKGISFLCRPNSCVNIYEIKHDEFVKLNFVKIRRYMKRNNLSFIEKEVYMGSQEKLQARLILYLMPEEELAKRLRKAKQNNKKKGRNNVSKEYKARAAFNLFITNADQEEIPAEQVWPVYRLRWQIELIFKIWKSICHVDKVKKVIKERFECYLYAKLIFIVLGWQIVWATARHLFHQEQKTLSFFKAFKTLFNEKIEDIRDVFVLGKQSAETFMLQFYDLSKEYHLLEKKKQSLSSIEILLMITSNCK
ncbi:MAG: IS4 family transposase [Desulfobacterales bacterium]